MPRVRDASARTDIRSVRLRNRQCGHYGRYSDPRKQRRNFLAVGLLVKPIRFVRWIPSFSCCDLSPLRSGTQSLCFCTDRRHAPRLCSFEKIISGHVHGARRAVPRIGCNRRSANLTATRHTKKLFDWLDLRPALSLTPMALGQPRWRQSSPFRSWSAGPQKP